MTHKYQAHLASTFQPERGLGVFLGFFFAFFDVEMFCFDIFPNKPF